MYCNPFQNDDNARMTNNNTKENKMVYVYKDADYDHQVTETVLEFENNDGKLYNEAMRDLSTAYKDNWDIEENNDYLDLKNCDLSNLNLNCST